MYIITVSKLIFLKNLLNLNYIQKKKDFKETSILIDAKSLNTLVGKIAIFPTEENLNTLGRWRLFFMKGFIIVNSIS